MMGLCNMEGSADKVYDQYRSMIRAMINSIVVNNKSVVSSDDLQQVGALALISALNSYNPSSGSLPSYIRKCVRNALLEQANSFNGVFTVDEKVRRQANAIIKLRAEGLDDEDIMNRLGVKTRATFLSLVGLIGSHVIDLCQVEITGETLIEEDDILKMLDEIGLSEIETRFVHLITNNHSMDEIRRELDISRSSFYVIRTSIRDKILAWGQD
jgi:RNA polymerase sigma factor (sigma-70 family)